MLHHENSKIDKLWCTRSYNTYLLRVLDLDLDFFFDLDLLDLDLLRDLDRVLFLDLDLLRERSRFLDLDLLRRDLELERYLFVERDLLLSLPKSYKNKIHQNVSYIKHTESLIVNKLYVFTDQLALNSKYILKVKTRFNTIKLTFSSIKAFILL